MFLFNRKPKFEYIPSAAEVQDFTQYTPDHIWLEKHEWVLLFVYDDLMTNRPRYDWLKDQSFFCGRAFTEDKDYALWKKKLGEFTIPIPLKGADRLYKGPGITSVPLSKMDSNKICPGILGHIKGEVHAIRPQLLWNKLDRHYENRLEFTRKRIKLLVPYRVQNGGVGVDHNEFVKVIKAWMYVGNKDYWNSQLDGGLLYTPVGAYVPNTSNIDGHELSFYYYYSRLEYSTNL